MNFAYPHAFWWLVFVPVIYGFLIWDDRRRLKRFEAFVQPKLWSIIIPEFDPRARARKSLTWLVALIFAILALARPQWGTTEEVLKMSGLDVMTVLDVSNSMETEDVVPSRLKKAKHFLRTLADKLEGDRLGLVVFAGGASVATPLTTDTEYYLEQLDIQSPKMIPTQGTDIGLGLETAERAMERGAAEASEKSGSGETPSRAIILISDGEDFEGAAQTAATALKAKGIRLYVFGVGTEKGGPVPVRDDSGSLINYKRDHAGKPVVSTFHPDDLTNIAASANGRYWNMTPAEDEIGDLLKDLGALSRGEFAEHHYIVYQERFQYPLAIAVFLLFLELSLSARRQATRKKLAVGAGRAVVAGFAAFAFCSSAHATGVETYRENQKGIEALKKGKVDEAQKSFGAAQALDPNLPELQYNQGLVHMQQGDTDSAVTDFQESVRGAMKNNQRDLLGRSFFNLGAARSKKGDLKGALQSYLSAIGAAQTTGDHQLEQDARKNIELLVEQQKQQQQQQKQQEQQEQQKQQEQQQQDQKKQDQQGQQEQKKDGSQGGQDQQKQDQKQGQQNQDQKKQEQQKKDGSEPNYDNSTSRGKKFDSKKLTPEDAERVMNELKSRESELQARMKKQNEHYGNQNNDW